MAGALDLTASALSSSPLLVYSTMARLGIAASYSALLPHFSCSSMANASALANTASIWGASALAFRRISCSFTNPFKSVVSVRMLNLWKRKGEMRWGNKERERKRKRKRKRETLKPYKPDDFKVNAYSKAC